MTLTTEIIPDSFGELFHNIRPATGPATPAAPAVHRLGKNIGARISSIRVSGDLSVDEVEFIRTALATYKVVVFEGAANAWHTDVTFVDRVPKASILRAVHSNDYDYAAQRQRSTDTNFGSHRRELHRVTLAGAIPGGVNGRPSTVLSGDASEYSVVDTAPPLRDCRGDASGLTE